MKIVTLKEHTALIRWDRPGPAPAGYLEARLYKRLKRYEQGFEKGALKWEDGRFKTTQWVGVIQVPGLCLEIIPKIDRIESNDKSRANLLWMLTRTGLLPLRARGIAQLKSQTLPLLEWLALRYAHSLKEEWLKGPERAYLSEQSNLRRYRGKLVLAQQISRNAAHKERFWCQYDEFTCDTALNRCLKAAAYRLLSLSRSYQVHDALRQVLLLMEAVSDVVITPADLEGVQSNRQNERFGGLFAFASLILTDQSPTFESGEHSCFSLLFDMNIVFERYIAALIHKKIKVLKGLPLKVYPQAKAHHRYLMQGPQGPVLQLKPDLLLEWQGQNLILDTKWKHLKQGRRQGVSPADLYQMYAYNRRYGCQTSFLIYPETPGIQPILYTALNAQAEADSQVGIRTVNLYQPLQTQEADLINQLTQILLEGFNLLSPESEPLVC